MSEAIIVVGSGRSPVEQAASRCTLGTTIGGDPFIANEILGQSVLQRVVAELKKAEFDEISVYVDASRSSEVEAAPGKMRPESPHAKPMRADVRGHTASLHALF